MPWLCTDRNMLFGIVALQRNLISHDALIGAMHEWTRNKTRTIGQILIDRSSLDPETHELLETWVDRELEHLDSERMSEATTSLIAPEKLGDLEPVWRSADGMAAQTVFSITRVRQQMPGPVRGFACSGRTPREDWVKSTWPKTPNCTVRSLSRRSEPSTRTAR